MNISSRVDTTDKSSTSLSEPLSSNSSPTNDSTLHPTQSKPSLSTLDLNPAIWPIDFNSNHSIYSANPPTGPGLSPRRDCRKTLTPKSSSFFKNQLTESTTSDLFSDSAPSSFYSDGRDSSNSETADKKENEFVEVVSEKGYQTRVDDKSLNDDIDSNNDDSPVHRPSSPALIKTPTSQSKKSRNLSDEVYSSPTRKNLDYQVAEALYLSAPPRTPSKAIINSPSRSIKTLRSPFKQSKLNFSSPTRRIPSSTLLFPVINDSHHDSNISDNNNEKNKGETHSISSSGTIRRDQTNSATTTIQPEDDVFYSHKVRSSANNPPVISPKYANHSVPTVPQISAAPTTIPSSSSLRFHRSRKLSPRLLFLLGFVMPPFWIVILLIPTASIESDNKNLEAVSRKDEKRLELGEGVRERETLRMDKIRRIRDLKRASVVMLLIYIVVGIIVGVLVGRKHYTYRKRYLVL